MAAPTVTGPADLVILNGKIATQDSRRTFVSAVAARDGRIVAVGADAEALGRGSRATKVVDAGGRTVIPGINDSHIHFIREGWHYHAELRWDGLRTLREALDRLRDQARRTPPGQWVRVVGSWSEYQFTERRTPTAEEINEASPDVPALVLHVYHDALLNRAGLAQQKIDPSTVAVPGGEIQKDATGNLTGFLIAKPTGPILYAAVAALPRLAREEQLNSTLHLGRELNRFGVTSVIDAGGGSQFFPEDYAVATELAGRRELSVRVAYSLFPQRPGHELEDFMTWAGSRAPDQGDEWFRGNGAGETLVFTGADYENFLEERPVLSPKMETEMAGVVRFLVQRRWPFRLHATYDESIERFLNVFEEVNDHDPLSQVRWWFDHAETVSDRNLDRIHRLGGGVSIQDRLAFQGEHFLKRYGEALAARAPPIAEMLQKGIPVAGGTDATRVASFNPWLALHWLITGRTVGETVLTDRAHRLDRMEALRLVTANAAWFSGEAGQKGSLEVGQLADLAVLSADYFSVPEDEIREIESVLTVVGGRVVYAATPFASEAPPPLPPVRPAWSPVAFYGGFPPHRGDAGPRPH